MGGRGGEVSLKLDVQGQLRPYFRTCNITRNTHQLIKQIQELKHIHWQQKQKQENAQSNSKP